MKLIIIIPAYNEEESIVSVIKGIPAQIPGVDACETVVIDDGSSDLTAKSARENGATVVSHNANKGVGAALTTGLEYAAEAGADIAVNIDADGQFSPGDINNLISPICQGRADLVLGNRFSSGRPENMPLSKYTGNKMMNKFVSRLAGDKFFDVSCGFRAYSREALLNMNLFGKFTYTQEMILDMKFKKMAITQIPISVRYFRERKSRVANNIFKYAWQTFKIILRSYVYYKPLRFFALPGIILIAIGFGFLAFLLWFKLVYGVYTPYKSFGFIGGGLAIFGLLLVGAGLIADILDKVRKTQDKLLYYIRKDRN